MVLYGLEIRARHEIWMSIAEWVDAWADTAPFAMILVDRDLGLCWCNPAASAFFETGGALVRRGPRIEARAERVSGQFERELDTLAQAPSLLVVGQRGPASCLVIAQRLRPPQQDLVMLILRPANEAALAEGIPLGDISGLFHLTETETLVVNRLMSRRSPIEIAEDMHIKLGTVRTHVRNIYAKMGVTTREALFLRCLPYAWLDRLG